MIISDSFKFIFVGIMEKAKVNNLNRRRRLLVWSVSKKRRDGFYKQLEILKLRKIVIPWVTSSDLYFKLSNLLKNLLNHYSMLMEGGHGVIAF